jgi:phthalate 4,5-dioxygenase oxygenase subunit
MYTAYRPAQPGHLYYRFAHFAMPFWTLFPNGPLSDNILAQAPDGRHPHDIVPVSWTR